MQHPSHEACIKRLRRIEGQVRGVTKMIEDERYCIDIITQTQAIRAALKKVEDELLKDHVATCVEGAILSGDPQEQRAKVNELIGVLGKLGS